MLIWACIDVPYGFQTAFKMAPVFVQIWATLEILMPSFATKSLFLKIQGSLSSHPQREDPHPQSVRSF